jgi:hypothetical protein
MILRNEEHDRQDMHSDLEHKIAARILKDNLAGKVIMPPKRQFYASSQGAALGRICNAE